MPLRGSRGLRDAGGRGVHRQHVRIGSIAKPGGGGTGPLGGPADRFERAIDVGRHPFDLTDAGRTALHRLSGRPHPSCHDRRKLHHVVGGLLRLIGELADLVGDDRESTPGGAGARGLDRRIEREQVGLLGDPAHDADEPIDALGGRVELAHLACRAVHRLADLDEQRARPLDLGALLTCLPFDLGRKIGDLLGTGPHLVRPLTDRLERSVGIAQRRHLHLGALGHLRHRRRRLRSGERDLLGGGGQLVCRRRDLLGGRARDCRDARERRGGDVHRFGEFLELPREIGLRPDVEPPLSERTRVCHEPRERGGDRSHRTRERREPQQDRADDHGDQEALPLVRRRAERVGRAVDLPRSHLAEPGHVAIQLSLESTHRVGTRACCLGAPEVAKQIRLCEAHFELRELRVDLRDQPEFGGGEAIAVIEFADRAVGRPAGVAELGAIRVRAAVEVADSGGELLDHVRREGGVKRRLAPHRGEFLAEFVADRPDRDPSDRARDDQKSDEE